jgi:hypothetical protein
MNSTLLSQIESETKRAPKEALIKQLDASTQAMVKLALDPDITFGVTAGDDEVCEENWRIGNSGGNKGRGMAEPGWNSWFLAQLEKW